MLVWTSRWCQDENSSPSDTIERQKILLIILNILFPSLVVYLPISDPHILPEFSHLFNLFFIAFHKTLRVLTLFLWKQLSLICFRLVKQVLRNVCTYHFSFPKWKRTDWSVQSLFTIIIWFNLDYISSRSGLTFAKYSLKYNNMKIRTWHTVSDFPRFKAHIGNFSSASSQSLVSHMTRLRSLSFASCPKVA